MLERLTSLFRSDAFVPTSAVFPAIDATRIAADLRLAEKGRERGMSEMPGPAEASLDATEHAIIDRIEEIRRRGLENYESNKEIYTRRLASAGSAHLEVKSVAGAAGGDFKLEVKAYRGQMAGPVDAVTSWRRALLDFRKRNGLERPAYKDGSIVVTTVVILACLILETVLNGYLFAQQNELGLLGGGLVALLVSVVNLSFAAVSGLFSRMVRHVSFFNKVFGLAIILLWIGGTLGLNLAVAHFRDAVETLDNWAAAADRSLDLFIAAPLDLNSIESWLLMFWGCLMALITFLKLIYFGEPYMGYGRISRRYEEALDDYTDIHDEALTSLRAKRDEAIDKLQDANNFVREQIDDAVDALYGQKMMRGHLQAFLQQCDLKVNVLLRTYRDANRKARRAQAPAHFDADFAFPAFPDSEVDPRYRDQATRSVDEINDLVTRAIEAIHADYRDLMEGYPDPATLIGIDMQARTMNPTDLRGPARTTP